MEYLLPNNELLALFTLSFLAATILPLGSEWYLITLIIQGHNAAEVVSVATAGNFLGGWTTYVLGFWSSAFITTRILRISQQDSGKALALYQRYGSWSLLLSWVPVIGDPLCLVAGSLKLHPLIFSFFVFTGKCGRYGILAYVTAQGIS
ncbi:MAG: DedA family protein [Desulfobulbaceae bacterium]|jgi:membrane protein YqaA with SNARE-associated domain|nr:DedA family protein [Desulfobulbaceae bacterium]